MSWLGCLRARPDTDKHGSKPGPPQSELQSSSAHAVVTDGTSTARQPAEAQPSAGARGSTEQPQANKPRQSLTWNLEQVPPLSDADRDPSTVTQTSGRAFPPSARPSTDHTSRSDVGTVHSLTPSMMMGGIGPGAHEFLVIYEVLELLRALSTAMRPTLSPLEQCAGAARVIASHLDIPLVMVTINADAGDLVTTIAVAGAASSHAAPDLGFPAKYAPPPPLPPTTSNKHGSSDLPSKRGSMDASTLRVQHSPGIQKTPSMNSWSSTQQHTGAPWQHTASGLGSLPQGLPPIPADHTLCMASPTPLADPLNASVGTGSGPNTGLRNTPGIEGTPPSTSDGRSTTTQAPPAWAPPGMRTFMELPIRRGGSSSHAGGTPPSIPTISGLSTPATMAGVATPGARTAATGAPSGVSHVMRSRPLGYLRLADGAESRLSDPRVAGLLEAAALQLAAPLEAGALPRVASLVCSVAGAPNVQALVRLVCDGIEGLLRARRQLRLQCRLVLLPTGGKEALMFEPKQPTQWSLMSPSGLPGIAMVHNRSNDNLAQLANATGFKPTTQAQPAHSGAQSTASAPPAASGNSECGFTQKLARLRRANDRLATALLSLDDYKHYHVTEQALREKVLQAQQSLTMGAGTGPGGGQDLRWLNNSNASISVDGRQFAADVAGQDHELYHENLMRSLEISVASEAGEDMDGRQFVARRIPLPNTLLGHELREQKPGGSVHRQGGGTWISDVATYMHTPERPSRDIAIAMHAQGCASLVLALVPAPHTAAAPTAAVTGRVSGVSTATGLSGPAGRQGSSVRSGDMVDGAPRVTIGVYLTSAVPLTGFNLQGILDEANELLALLARPLLAQLGGPLMEEWSALSGVGTPVSGLSAQHDASLRAARNTFDAGAPKRMSQASVAKLSIQQASMRMGALPQGSPGPGTGQQTQASSAAGAATDKMALAGGSPSAPSKLNGDSWAGGMTANSTALSVQDMLSSQRSISVLPADVAAVGPLVASLQEKLRAAFAQSLAHNLVFNRPNDLAKVRVHSPLGRGGFGAVYRGLWCGLDVAVKINPQKADLSDSLREAMEIAVMSTVSHPSILCVINFWTDVLVYPAAPGTREVNGLVRLEAPRTHTSNPPSELPLRDVGGLDSTLVEEQSENDSTTPGTAGPSPRTRHDEEPEKPGPKPVRSLVIVMEVCDQGTLEQAMQAGVFIARPLRAGPAGPLPNMLAVLTTLLEVALALRHLHSLQLVHADVKPANVLLKASPSDPRGFTAKLCDFGLVKLAAQSDATDSARRDVFTGTVSYAPPEMLMGSPSPDASWDVYAFGLIMWNLACGSALYPGMTNPQVAQGVVFNDMRPQFPMGFSRQYVGLAQRCWAREPLKRPSTDQVVNALARMLMALRDVPSAQRTQLPQKPQSTQPPQQLTPQQQQHIQRVQQAQLQQLQQLQKEATGAASQQQQGMGTLQQAPPMQGVQFALQPQAVATRTREVAAAPENVVINLAPPAKRCTPDALVASGLH